MIDTKQGIPSQAEFIVIPSSRKWAALRAENKSKLAEYGRALCYCFLFMAIQALVAWGALTGLKTGYHRAWMSADNAGFVRHSRITPVVLTNDWMVGEYRECTGNASFFDGEIDSLTCPEVEQREWQPSDVRQLPVHYWGRVLRFDHVHPVFGPDQAESASWDWRCQREEASLKCWSLN
jgi:hypothetical protein